MKRVLDFVAYFIAAAGMVWAHMPEIAAFATTIYVCIQIWDSKPMTRWRQTRASKRRVLRKLVAEREELRRLHSDELALRRLRGDAPLDGYWPD